ncbi:hypothetical protein GQ53DRAFT_444820 [Thozetella sp. PMI_491]|nr:hypothetical protein GQ53DRAFT_444820 [Thozetella sp. PMI_491]
MRDRFCKMTCWLVAWSDTEFFFGGWPELAFKTGPSRVLCVAMALHDKLTVVIWMLICPSWGPNCNWELVRGTLGRYCGCSGVSYASSLFASVHHSAASLIMHFIMHTHSVSSSSLLSHLGDPSWKHCLGLDSASGTMGQAEEVVLSGAYGQISYLARLL